MSAGQKKAAEALISRFEINRLLKQGMHQPAPVHTSKTPTNRTDQNGRRIALLGTIDGKQGILIAERAAFATESLEALEAFHSAIARVNNLGDNDIYRWYLASSGDNAAQDLKLNIIWPCTEQHVKKYSEQLVRMVTETPEIYRRHVRPYMGAKRDEGRLNWVFNILEGRTEQEDVILRDEGNGQPEDAFLMLPDLNWDRKTMGSLHLLALVQRRDIWSLRDLRKRHVPWLRYLRQRVLEATVKMYPALEQDQLKLYVHCMFVFFLLYRLWLMLAGRPTHLLSLPRSCRQCHAGGGLYAGYGQGVWIGEPHLAAGDHCGRRGRQHGRCELDVFPGRGQRAVDRRLCAVEKQYC